jgi:hypothetical protein
LSSNAFLLFLIEIGSFFLVSSCSRTKDSTTEDAKSLATLQPLFRQSWLTFTSSGVAAVLLEGGVDGGARG